MPTSFELLQEPGSYRVFMHFTSSYLHGNHFSIPLALLIFWFIYSFSKSQKGILKHTKQR
eukprot:UN19614